VAARRAFGEIYKEQRRQDKTVPSRRRARVFSGLSVPLIIVRVLHRVPLLVKIVATLVYVAVGIWAGVTSGRMAKAEPPLTEREHASSPGDVMVSVTHGARTVTTDHVAVSSLRPRL